MTDDGFVNHGSMQTGKQPHQGWVSRKRALSAAEESLLVDLKTVSMLSKAKWIALARVYKARQDFPRAEVAYIGARYCDIADRELMQEWLGVFQLNRATQLTKEALLREANLCQQGMQDVLNGPQERLLSELQSLLFLSEREEVIDVGEGTGMVTKESTSQGERIIVP
jgi:hypothetical protein